MKRTLRAVLLLIVPGACSVDPVVDCESSTQRIVDGVCEEVDVLALTVGEHMYQDVSGAPSATTYGHASVVGYRSTPPGDNADLEVLAEDGACTVIRSSYSPVSLPPAMEAFVPSAGPISLNGPLGAYSLSAPDYDTGFNDDTENVMDEGDVMTFKGTGGADFPSFELSVTAPAELVIEAQTPVRGEDLVVAWTGTGTQPVELRLVSDGFTTIVCQVDDTGTFTIDGSLTAHLLPASGYPDTILLSRHLEARIDIPGQPVRIVARAFVSAEHTF